MKYPFCKKVLNDDECETLIQKGLDQPLTDAWLDQGHYNPTYRKTFVRFLHYQDPETRPILSKIDKAARDLNQVLGFDITYSETTQFGKYEVGSHYDWHVDIFPESFLNDPRKITSVTMLSDPSSYEGGELQFKMNRTHYDFPNEKGMVIIFPSFLLHRVNPVTSGERYSATTWYHGPKFK
jgi:PKHD-type hydroxylase